MYHICITNRANQCTLKQIYASSVIHPELSVSLTIARNLMIYTKIGLTFVSPKVVDPGLEPESPP